MSEQEPRTTVIVREGKDGTPYYEVFWRSAVESGRPSKRRLGRAWLARNQTGEWRKRKGRPDADDWIEPLHAPSRAIELMRAVELERQAQADSRQAELARILTFRTLAHAWLDELRREAKPSTVRDYEALLREPGSPHRRGGGKSPGWIMAAFGDRDARTIAPKEIAEFLRGLDARAFTPRNVNKYRQTLSAIFSFGYREDTYELARNPVERVPKRREPSPAALDYYEVHEVEAVARQMAAGAHRKESAMNVSGAELIQRAADDARDADLIRVLLYTGMRLGEVRALRWRDVLLEQRGVVVRRGVSAGREVDRPKGGRLRVVPLSTHAVEVLIRLARRPDFVQLDDLVFPGRAGRMLDDSALRKRYRAACEMAGLRRVKLHGLRHAAGSLVARVGSSVETRDFMGHSKLTTTDRYVSARFSPDFLRRLDGAFDRLEAVEPSAHGSSRN